MSSRGIDPKQARFTFKNQRPGNIFFLFQPWSIFREKSRKMFLNLSANVPTKRKILFFFFLKRGKGFFVNYTGSRSQNINFLITWVYLAPPLTKERYFVPKGFHYYLITWEWSFIERYRIRFRFSGFPAYVKVVKSAKIYSGKKFQKGRQ